MLFAILQVLYIVVFPFKMIVIVRYVCILIMFVSMF